ncbi:MAG: HRDC domain-containing protein, partial [Thermotogota bacterium]
KELTEKEIRELINFLSAEGYLEVSNGVYPIIKLTKKSWDVLKGFQKVVKKTTFIKVRRKENNQLYQALKELRKTIALEENVPPYIVFHDYSIREMSNINPSTVEELIEIKGVGEKKLKKYGERFLQLIKQYKGI